jgi:hypothetical protein
MNPQTNLAVPASAGPATRKFFAAVTNLSEKTESELPTGISDAVRKIVNEQPELFLKYLVEAGILTEAGATLLLPGGRK